MFKKILTACSATALCLGAGSAMAITPFQADVTASIDSGIEWLASQGAYNNPSSAGEAAGLTLLALLEKRPSGDPASAAQGYAGASETDKGRMRKSVAYILNTVPGVPFDSSYRDGAYAQALALYLRTGGVDRGDNPDLPAGLPYDLKGGLDAIFDRFASYQRASGYWCYGPGFTGCDDSSTTQFVIAGLAALRSVYADSGKPWADPARLATLEVMASKARQGYVTNGTQSLTWSACGDLGGGERGHGYNVGNTPTLQQTASGTWIQLAGGGDINDASVQGYLKWIRNRYRYTDLGGAGDGWQSYWYYLWSSSKAFLFLRAAGVTPDGLNIGVNDIGQLPASESPACNQRQVHRNPSLDSRIPLFGAGSAGYYSAETPDFYYDYAYTILSRQCADGRYSCNGAPGGWRVYDGQAYALLVLQRSVGGGCIDANKDGVCDSGDEPGPPPVAASCDIDNDGKVTMDDVWAMLPWAQARLRVGGGNAVPPGGDAANAVTFASTDKKSGWFGSSGDSEINVADFTRCVFKANGK